VRYRICAAISIPSGLIALSLVTRPRARALLFGQNLLLKCATMKLNPWCLYQRSRLFALFKRYDQAVDDLREALRIEPSYARAASSLGFFTRPRPHELAVEQFRTLEPDPDNAVLLFDLVTFTICRKITNQRSRRSACIATRSENRPCLVRAGSHCIAGRQENRQRR